MSYSHGLEKIYAFETINPLSVKSLVIKQQIDSISHLPINATKEQLLFNFGPSHTEGLPSLRLKEPISSVQLSPFAGKALMQKAIKTVEDACRFLESIQKGEQPAGLGLGHIDELTDKLATFIGTNPFGLKKAIHWQSLIRLSCQDMEPKERYCFLARYGLEKLYVMSPPDLQEIGRMTSEQIERTIDKCYALLATDELSSYAGKIVEAFVLPWMRRRDGIALRTEIQQRLLSLSEDGDFFWQIQAFLNDVCPLLQLPQVGRDAYACDLTSACEFHQVEELLKSYFYQPFCRYPLKKLIYYVRRQLALGAIAVTDRFIEKVINHSSHFLVVSLDAKEAEVVQRALF